MGYLFAGAAIAMVAGSIGFVVGAAFAVITNENKKEETN